MRRAGWWITAVCLWIAVTAAALAAWFGLAWIRSAPSHPHHHFLASLSSLASAVSLALVVVLAWLGLPFVRGFVTRSRVKSDIFRQSSEH